MGPGTLGSQWSCCPEAVCHIARRIRHKAGRSFVQLPFDTTLEAQCLGAIINQPANALHAQVVEPTNGEPIGVEDVFSRIKDAVANEIWERNSHVEAIRNAAENLVLEGERLVFNITGPVTLLSSLVGFATLMKLVRRPFQDFETEIQTLLRFYRMYAAFFSEIRPGLYSYADPIGGSKLLGPKVFDSFSAPLQLRCIAAVRESGIPMHVCGMLSENLQRGGYMNFPEGSPAFFQGVGYQRPITGLNCINGWK